MEVLNYILGTLFFIGLVLILYSGMDAAFRQGPKPLFQSFRYAFRPWKLWKTLPKESLRMYFAGIALVVISLFALANLNL